MKKIFGALMIAACFGMVMPVQAQIHFGVKGGLNLSKASLSNVGDNFKKDNFTGFFIGPMAEFTIPIVGLGVDASLLFAQRGIKVSDEDGDITVKQNGIDIPEQHSVSSFVAHLYPFYIYTFFFQGVEYIFGMLGDILLQLFYRVVFPCLRFVLFTGICPSITVMEIYHETIT